MNSGFGLTFLQLRRQIWYYIRQIHEDVFPLFDVYALHQQPQG